MTVLFPSREQIFGDLIRTILANTDLNDVAPGSSLSTLLEAIASVQYQNYTLILKILESTSLESLTGVDLDRKAASIGLSNTVGGVGRRPASASSGIVRVSSSFTKLSSKLYAGKPAPFAGSSVLNVEDASTWPTSGSIYIGRGTADKLEGPIPYSLGTTANKGIYWEVTLSGPLTKNHALSEQVVVAQGGDRVVSAGTIISTTANATTPAVSFTTDVDLLIPDGEDSGEVSVTAIQFGESSNVLSGSVNRFATPPFVGARVTNTTTFANGQSTESDEDLRQRIRDYPATLARGTKNAITAALIGLRDPNTGKAISSVIVIEPTEPGEPSRIYINDGSLLEPTFNGQSYELLVDNASGQEVFFRTANAPITSCVAIGSNNAPFSLSEEDELTIIIDGIKETYTVTPSNYSNLESVSSFEIVRDFNEQANIAAFRTINGGANLAVFDLSGDSEILQVQEGDLQKKLGLPTAQIRPIYVYKNSQLLSFKGKTATLSSQVFPWSVTEGDLDNVQMIVDGVVQTFTVTNDDFVPYFSTIETASLENWVNVLKTKVAGVRWSVVGSTLVAASYQENSNESYLEILEKQVFPGTFTIDSITDTVTVNTLQPHGLTGTTIIKVVNASYNNLNGSYTATVTGPSSFTFTSTLEGQGVLFFESELSGNAGWVGVGKIWSPATVTEPLSSTGASKDYSLNRFLGEIRLAEKPEEGSRIEIATRFTRAQISAIPISGSVYSVPPLTGTIGSSRIIVAFDGLSQTKDLLFSLGTKIEVVHDTANRMVQFNALIGALPNTSLFANLEVGDYIYITPDESLTPALPAGITGIYRIKQMAENFSWIKFEVSSVELAAFAEDTYDITEQMLFAFRTEAIPQVVDFGSSATLTVDGAVNLINSQIKGGSAQKTGTTAFVLRSNDFSSGSAAVLAVVGNASGMFERGVSTSIQSHTASSRSSYVNGVFPITRFVERSPKDSGLATKSFLEMKTNFTDVLDESLNPAAQASSVVDRYPVGFQEFWLTGKFEGFTGRVYNTEEVAPYSGILRGDRAIKPPGTFDTELSTIDNYSNFSYRLEDLPFTSNDRLVVEMDLDDTEKTVAVSMFKKALIQDIDNVVGNGLGKTLSFKLSDPEDLYDHDDNIATPSIPRPFFDLYSTFRTFDLKDFRILNKSIGIYKDTGADRALVLRSTRFGGVYRLRVDFRYPTAPNQADPVIYHKNAVRGQIPETTLVVTMPSDALKQFINSGLFNIDVSPSGNLVELKVSHPAIDDTKFVPGYVMNIGGVHPLSGAYKIIASSPGEATVLAPGLLTLSTEPVTGITIQTQSSSNLIRVLHPSHGFVTGDLLNIDADGTVNGIPAGALGGSGIDITVIDANTYEYTASGTANGPVAGTMTASFQAASRTISTSPGSATITVTQPGHNLLTGDTIDIANVSADVGGIPAGDMEISSALVSYINANSYSYTALSAAPTNVGNVTVEKVSTPVLVSAINALNNTVSITHVNHGFTSGAVITVSGASEFIDSTLDVGGIPVANLQLSGVSVTVIDAHSYTYTATASASSNDSAFARVFSGTANVPVTIETLNTSSTVTVYHPYHGLTTGALINVSSVNKLGANSVTPGSIGDYPTATINGSFVITVVDANTYRYTVPGLNTTNEDGYAQVVFSPFITTATTTNGSAVVSNSYTNHRLANGSRVTISAISDIGAIPNGDLSFDDVGVTVLDSNTFSYTASSASPASSGTADINRSDISISVSVPNGFATTAGLVDATFTNHRFIVGETVSFSSAVAIGGISAVDLSVSKVVGDDIIAGGVQVLTANSFRFLANASSPIQAGTASIIRPISLAASQYTLSAYPITDAAKTLDEYAELINEYSPLNPIATAEAIGTDTDTNTITEATYIINSTSLVGETALWQSGTTVRIDMANTGNIQVNDIIDVSGFANASNNGQFTVTNVLLNSFIEVENSARTDATDDEIAASADIFRPPYGISDLQSAYDFFSFACKVSGSASIYEFPRPSDFPDLASYQAAIALNSVKALVQTPENLFPTVDEASPTPYSPVNEEVYIVPSNTKTLRDWMAFPAISSLSVQSDVEIVDDSRFIQISSKLDGFEGAVRVTGVTANSNEVFISGVSNRFTDKNNPFSTVTKVNVDYAKVLGFPKNALVKVENSVNTEILRSYRTVPTGSEITSANSSNIDTIFRQSTELEYVRVSANLTRIRFKRFGMGTSQSEPLSVAAADLVNDISVEFSLTAPDYLTPLPEGVVRVKVSDPGDAAFLSARVGDMMYIRGDSTGYTSPFPANIQCKAPTGLKFGIGETIGYPVVHVFNSREILVIAPNITGTTTVSVPNTNNNPEYKTSLVFMPQLVAEKNVRTNKTEGVLFDQDYGSGSVYVVARKIGTDFLSIFVSNSPSELTDTMLLDQMQVNTDDYVVLGSGFSLVNQGKFKLVAHNGKNNFIVYHPEGIDEYFDSTEGLGVIGSIPWLVGPISSPRPVRVFDAQSLFVGDFLRISSPKTSTSWFPNSMIGQTKITEIGYYAGSDMTTGAVLDESQVCPYIEVETGAGPTTPASIFLGNNWDAVGFKTSSPVMGFRKILGYAVDPQQPDQANLFMAPDLQSFPMSSNFGTKITAIGKIGFPEEVFRGIDGYRTYSGLVQEGHKVVDGVPTNAVLFPGVRAAGTSVEILTPLLKTVSISMQVKAKDGVDFATITEIVKSTVAGYVNSLGVSRPVVLSEIIRIVQSIAGVFSVTIINTFPAAQGDRIVVGDIEKAFVLDANRDIVVS